MYAGDFKVIPGTYWQGVRNLDWAGRVNQSYISAPANWRHPFDTSVLSSYVSTVDRILECPTAKRRANLWFDYTMMIRFAGARLDLPWDVLYPPNPSQPNTRVRFRAVPLLIEEDSEYWNRTYDDGSFAGTDQFANWHVGTGTVGYLDASAAPFRSPKGSNPHAVEPGDLNASHLRLSARRQLYTINASSASEYGWVNNPR